jgi:hypothetical protein
LFHKCSNSLTLPVFVHAKCQSPCNNCPPGLVRWCERNCRAFVILRLIFPIFSSQHRDGLIFSRRN